MATITHQKTNTISDWTQADLDAQIALGNFPPGTLLADIVLPTDWNNNHNLVLGADENFVTDAQVSLINSAVQPSDLTAYVPYTGATGNVDLGTHALITDKITSDSSAGLILENASGGDVLHIGNGGGVNATAYGGWNFDGATADTIASFGASKTLTSLSTATYPSLTELSYVKGVTSSIQTQIDTKTTGAASSTDEAIARFDGLTGKLLQNSVVTIDNSGVVSGATQLNVDNLRLDGNTLSATNTNGDVVIQPNGTGSTFLSNQAATQYWTIDSTGLLNGVTSGAMLGVNLDKPAFIVPGSVAMLFFRFFLGVPGQVFTDLVGADIASVDYDGLHSVVNAVYGFAHGSVSPASFNTNQNDYAGLVGGGYGRITTTANVNITGQTLPNNSRGQWKVGCNVGTETVNLVSQDTASTATNRYALANDDTLNIYPGEMFIEQYDTTSSRWRAAKLSNITRGHVNALATATYLI